MSDMNFQNTLALREFLNQLMPSVALAFSEQLNREVFLSVMEVQVVPMLGLQSRTETVLATTFSLNYPKAVESVLYVMETDALVLYDLHLGNDGTTPPKALTDAQVEGLGDVMTGGLRGFVNGLSSLTSEQVDLETNSTSLGALSLPPVFALDPSIIEVLLTLSVPGVNDYNLSLLITPEIANLLVPDAGSSGSDDMLSADEIEKMMSGLGGHTAGASGGFTGSEMPPMGMGGGLPFSNFGSAPVEAVTMRPIDLIMDIPLEVTVELGRIRMLIKDVLDLSSGSIVELDRVAGEPVDLLVNGRLVAKGEVVVIEDNFGIRITEIVSPAERVVGLGKGR